MRPELDTVPMPDQEDQIAWEQEQAAQAASYEAELDAAEAAWYAYQEYLEDNNISDLPW